MKYTEITSEKIKALLDLHEPEPEGIYFKNSVLVPLIYIDGELNVLFTQRSLELKKQPGDICFPGGRHEKGETKLETALRETTEELGIAKENIRLLGATDFIITPFGTYITPFIGVIENTDVHEIRFSKAEVNKLVPIPLCFFMENPPAVHYISFKLMEHGSAYVDYDTSFESAGINQTNFKIWINVMINVRIVNPLVSKSVEVQRKIMLIDTVIKGDIPMGYLNISGQ